MSRISKQDKENARIILQHLDDAANQIPEPPDMQATLEKAYHEAQRRIESNRLNRFAGHLSRRRLVIAAVAVFFILATVFAVPPTRAAIFSFFEKIFQASETNRAQYELTNVNWKEVTRLHHSDGYSVKYSSGSLVLTLLVEEQNGDVQNFNDIDNESFFVELPISSHAAQCMEDADGFIAFIYPDDGTSITVTMAGGIREQFVDALSSIELVRGR